MTKPAELACGGAVVTVHRLAYGHAQGGQRDAVEHEPRQLLDLFAPQGVERAF